MDPLSDWQEGDDEIVEIGGPLPRVVHVEAVAPLTLFVRFDDGVEGRVRFAESKLHGVFVRLRDADFFGQVGISYGAVSWPDEAPDICPDHMHDEVIKGQGEWLLQ